MLSSIPIVVEIPKSNTEQIQMMSTFQIPTVPEATLESFNFMSHYFML